MSFFEELKRRNVVRAGIGYAVLGWLVIQVTDTVAPALNLPSWTLTFVVWAGIVGFPFVLLFAWIFEWTPEGLKRESEIEAGSSITRETGRKIDRAIIVLLALAVVVLVVDNYIMAPSQEASAQAGSFDSIGVLPFANMSNDPEQEYFSDGIAEELLNSLAKLESLQVAARTSAFAFKGQNIDVRDIGRRLDVDTVLEGSVRKAGNRVRITAQLIDVSNGYHLWSETYDRELTDIFAVQDEITAAIVSALRQHLDTGEQEKLAADATSSLEAYDLYLKGRHVLRGLADESNREALNLFRAATDADPDFAPAWAARGLAVMLLLETAFWGDIPREEARVLARSNIDRALALDPRQAEAHVAEALLLADDYDYAGALDSVATAIELNPNLADAWTWHGRLLARVGRAKEARESMRRAMAIDPLNEQTFFYASWLATEYFDEAYYRQVREASTRFPMHESRLRYVDWALAGRDPLALKGLLEDPDMQPWIKANILASSLYVVDETSERQRSRNPGEGLFWSYLWSGQFEQAMAVFEELSPDRRAAAINQEELSIGLAQQGRCEDSLAILERLQPGEPRLYGVIQINAGRSNLNLALNRAYCLRALGREAESEKILRDAREFIDVLKANTRDGFFKPWAKLLVLEGQSERAIDVLATAQGVGAFDLHFRYDPVLASLTGEPRYKALVQATLLEVNTFRDAVGMPPLELPES